MNSLKAQAVLALCVFMLLVVGGSSFFYFLFAVDYYIEQKKETMEESYWQLQSVDLSQEALEEDEVIQALEDESFSVIICDENMQAVYASKVSGRNNLIQTYIAGHTEDYTVYAHAVYERDIARKPIVLKGLIRQENRNYYVYLYENTTVIRRSVTYVNEFLRGVVVIAMLLGIVFAWVLSKAIVGPVERIRSITGKIAEGDYSARLEKPMPNKELEELRQSINRMTDRIQNDISDLNNYNYLLLNKNHSISQFEEHRRQFIRNVTHELKTPLAIISSQVEMMEIEGDKADREAYCASILEEVNKLSKMVSSLLKDSFTESPVANPQMVRGSLSELMKELMPKYEVWMRTNHFCWQSEIQNGCMAVFDKMEIELAANNYIMNAGWHTPKGGQIRASLKKENGGIRFSVYNEGEPIAQADKEKIWDCFYQGQEKKTENAEVGLGLYIVKNIVSRHQGLCGMENLPDGVKFWLWLPEA